MDNLIKNCIDLDEWKYSWHNKWKTIKDYKNARQVIKEKIECRIEELRLLYDGLERVDEIISCKQEEEEPIEACSLQAIIKYIQEGEPDLKVVTSELQELILRSKGEYGDEDFKCTCKQCTTIIRECLRRD